MSGIAKPGQGPFIKVADLTQIKAGQHKVLYFRQKEIVLFNLAGECYALDNLCPHRNGPLSEGEMADGVVICPLHGARFDIKTGKGLPGPHRCDVKAYTVKVEGTEVKIQSVP